MPYEDDDSKNQTSDDLEKIIQGANYDKHQKNMSPNDISDDKNNSESRKSFNKSMKTTTHKELK